MLDTQQCVFSLLKMIFRSCWSLLHKMMRNTTHAERFPRKQENGSLRVPQLRTRITERELCTSATRKDGRITRSTRLLISIAVGPVCCVCVCGWDEKIFASRSNYKKRKTQTFFYSVQSSFFFFLSTKTSLSIVYRVKNNNKTDKVLFRGGVFLAWDSAAAVIVYVYKAKPFL